MQVAVPPYLQLQLDVASAAVMGPMQQGGVTQVMRVSNGAHGTQPIHLRLRISWQTPAGAMVDEADVVFPAAL